MYKTLLFPIDQSRESREAAETVAQMVKIFQSKLVLLSVVEPPSEEPATTAAERAMTSAEAIAKLLEDAKAMFRTHQIEAEVLEREGNPAFTICDVADEIDAGLIIMGCRGLGLTEEGVAESVTHRVINLSPCPVLIVP